MKKNAKKRIEPSLGNRSAPIGKMNDIKKVITPARPAKVVKPGWGRGIAVTFATVMLAVAAGVLLIDRMMRPDAFTFSRIQVLGDIRQVDVEQVRASADAALKGNFFAVNLDQIEAAVREVPWVFNTSVRRKWPDTLVVNIQEPELVAKWGEDKYLEINGTAISLPKDVDIKHLPKLSGPANSAQEVLAMYKKWSANLKLQGLHIKALELSPRRAWKLMLFNPPPIANENSKDEKVIEYTNIGVLVLLGKDNIEHRLARLTRAYKQEIKNDFFRVSQIDLRYPNGFALKWLKEEETINQKTKSPTKQTRTNQVRIKTLTFSEIRNEPRA